MKVCTIMTLQDALKGGKVTLTQSSGRVKDKACPSWLPPLL